MSAICFSKFTTSDIFFSTLLSSSPSSNSPKFPTFNHPLLRKFPPSPCSQSITRFPRKPHIPGCSHASEAEELSSPEEEDEWLKKLPDKEKPLYSHSLPCIEAWLRSLGFYQSKEDRALWLVENPDWHAQLSLDVTDLYIRYLKTGPGNLEKDVERRFSYALSREDIENAVLGGP
ncbi:tRNA dimethylallyltransferase [Trema orientale]|uniref:tRNA dimethylallyltransferase n=1 Tax=Trema orientale TaxID=63057 RepID=A0A2P5FGK2_TREOI|nr:tRNA dimethylallyltransferase [Trema orientale]